MNTLSIGTKADRQLSENTIPHLLATSAKTGLGFNEFRALLADSLSLTTKPKLQV